MFRVFRSCEEISTTDSAVRKPLFTRRYPVCHHKSFKKNSIHKSHETSQVLLHVQPIIRPLFQKHFNRVKVIENSHFCDHNLTGSFQNVPFIQWMTLELKTKPFPGIRAFVRVQINSSRLPVCKDLTDCSEIWRQFLSLNWSLFCSHFSHFQINFVVYLFFLPSHLLSRIWVRRMCATLP